MCAMFGVQIGSCGRFLNNVETRHVFTASHKRSSPQYRRLSPAYLLAPAVGQEQAVALIIQVSVGQYSPRDPSQIHCQGLCRPLI